MLNACYSGGSALLAMCHCGLPTETQKARLSGGRGVQDYKEDKKTAERQGLAGGGLLIN